MFTGIIREVGRVRAIERSEAGARVTIAAPEAATALAEGGSIAVDGVCLTATSIADGVFGADVVPETIRRTRFAEITSGSRVNLEAPLRAGDLLDGHLVQGHVDGVGEVVEVRKEGTQTWVTVAPGDELAPFLAQKGSVAVNGVSLTIADAQPATFSVALIPTTLKWTNLNELQAGSRVNLEVDILARYVARLREMTE